MTAVDSGEQGPGAKVEEAESPVRATTQSAHILARIGRNLKERFVSDDPLTRTLSLASLVNTFGNGLLTATTAIFFTRFVGLSNHSLALTYTAVAAVSLSLAMPVGNLVDKWRPRRTGAASMMLLGVLSTSTIFVTELRGFVALQLLTAVVNVFMRVNQQAFMGRLREGAARVKLMAYQRAVTNVGIGLGSLAAGIALAINTATAFKVLFILDGFTWVLAAIIRLRLPDLDPIPTQGKRRRTEALRDRAYLGIVGINTVLAMNYQVLNLAVPLYVDQFTKAPKWVVAATMLVNTAMVALFQVQASRGTDTPRRAAGVMHRSAYYFAAGYAVYAAAKWANTAVLAAAVVLAGAFLHTLGELRQAASAWGLQYSLARKEYQGQYQSVWSMGWQINGLITPPLVTALCLGLKEPGWWLLGAMAVAAGSLTPRVTRAALASRPELEHAA
ncbi:MAG: MFS transporter [Actinobacteria bacterium]|nr:MFS transporter [Actinomycetota bacterium]